MTDNVANYLRQKIAGQAARTATATVSGTPDPDQVAEGISIGRELNVPPSVVTGAPDVFRKQLAQKKATTALQGAPKTQAWLNRMRENAGLAKDDLENLSWFEKTGRETKEFGQRFTEGATGVATSSLRARGQKEKSLQAGVESSAPGFVQEAKRQAERYRFILDRGVGDDMRSPMSEDERALYQQRLESAELAISNWSSVEEDGAWMVGDRGAGADDAAKALKQWTVDTFGEAPADDSLWADLSRGLGSFAAFVIPSLLPGGQVVTAQLGSDAARMEAYDRAKAAGASEDDATIAANIAGIVGTSEAVPIASALNRLPRPVRNGVLGVLGKFVSDYAKGAIEEGAQEGFMGIAQNLISRFTYDPEQDILTDDVGRQVTVGALLGGFLSGGATLVQEGRRARKEKKFDNDMNASLSSGATSAILDQMDGMAAGSKLKQRSADKFQEALEAQGLDDTPLFVPADDLRELFQSSDIPVADQIEALGLDQETFDAMADGGQDVTISAATYASKISGTEMADWFKQNATTDQDEMSLAEAARFNETAAGQVAQAIEQGDADQERAASISQEEADISAELNNQIQAAGMSASTGRFSTLPLTKFISTQAQRLGMSPKELAERYGIRIERGVADQALQDVAPVAVEAAPESATPQDVAITPQDVAITPTGREVPVTYKVIDAGSLIASQTDDGRTNPDFPAELQPRDRTRDASNEQIRKIAQNLDPRLLGPNPRASDGAPIISPEGVVESGNGRVLAIRQAYATNPDRAAAYKDYIGSLGYDVSGMERPVLVRERSADMTMADRQAFTRESNERDTMEMSDTERAMADANALPDAILPLYTGGDVDLAQNREFVRAFMSGVVAQGDQGSFIDAEGRMSQRAVRRVQAALLARAYGDSGLVEAVMEVTDGNIKAIGGALMDVAPMWAQMRRETEQGTVAPEMDQTAALLEAVNMVRRSRDEGKPMSDLVGQTDIFSGESMSPMGEGFLRLMFRDSETLKRPAGRNKVSEALGFYIEEALKAGPGVDLLGETADPVQIITAAKERQYEKTDTQPRFFTQPARSAIGGDPTASGDGGQPGGGGTEGADSTVGGEASRDPTAPTQEELNEFSGLLEEGAPKEVLRETPAAKAILSVLESGATIQQLRNHPTVVTAEAVMATQRVTFTEEQMDGPYALAMLNKRTYVDKNANQSYYGLAELIPALDRISASWAGDVKQERRAIILTGPPAAGKSTIAEQIAPMIGARIIDGDEVKKLIPEFKGGIGAGAVHEESSKIGKYHSDVVRARGDNMILPKVGDNPAKLEKEIKQLQAEGYTVELVLMEVEPTEAFNRMIGRFAKTGRLVPPDIAIAAGSRPPGAYQAVKKKGIADGYTHLDNNVALGEATKVIETTTREGLFGPVAGQPEGEGGAGQAVSGVGGDTDTGSAGRAESAEGRTLNQSAVETPGFKAWFGDSKIVDENGDPLVVYHGTRSDEDFEAFDLGLSGKTDQGWFGKAIYASSNPNESNYYAGATAMEWKSENPRNGRNIPLYVKAEKPFVLGSRGQSKPRSIADALDALFQGLARHYSKQLGTRYFANSNPAKYMDPKSQDYDAAVKFKAEVMPLIDSFIERLGGGPSFQSFASQIRGELDVWGEYSVPEGAAEKFQIVSDNLPKEAKALGYDSIVVETKGKDGKFAEVAVFDPAQVKSAFNRGTFDPNDPRILYQADAEFADYNAAKAEADRLVDEIASGGDAKAAFDAFGDVADKRDSLAQAIADNEGGIELTNGNGLFSAVTKSQAGGDGWRVTVFNDSGFLGHTEHDTKLAAVTQALEEGYTTESEGALREAMRGRAFFQRYMDQEGPRGSIKIPKAGIRAGDSVIKLLESYDLSTFLHESSHFFLEAFSDMASNQNAPEQMQSDMATIREWLGNDGGEFTTDQHEKFARGGEAYFMEGKAPSLALADAFSRFKAWLTRIYTSVSGLDVAISPEIREVFDRMLATDSEIADAREAQEVGPLFSAAPPGMSGQDWNAYQIAARRGEEEAQRILLGKTMEKIRREKAAWYRAEKKAVRKEVTDEVSSRKEYRLIEMLANQKWIGSDESVPDTRIDRKELVDAFGKGILADLGRSKIGGNRAIYSADGSSLQEISDFFGFTGPTDMIEALKGAGKRKDVIAATVEEVMLERHGDPLTDGTIEEEAITAIHNDQQSRQHVSEARHLARELGRETRQMKTRAYRQRAKLMLGRMTVRDATRPATFLAAERKASRAAQDAFAKVQRGRGDQEALSTALQAKEQQILNGFLYNESRKFEELVRKRREKMRNYNKKSVREKIGGITFNEDGTENPGYIQQIDAILDDYDFRVRSPGQVQRSENLRAFVDRMEQEGRGGELAIDDRLLDEANRKHYTRLSVDELRGLFDTIENIDHMGRFKKKLMDARDARDMDEVVGTIIPEFERNVKGTAPNRTRTASESRRKLGRDYLNTVLNADTLLREIDGFKDLGPTWTALKDRIDKGMNRLTERRIGMAKSFDEIYDAYSTKEKREMAVKKQNDALGGLFSKWDLIALALNTGNDDNFQRLTNPKVKGHFNQADIEAALSTLDNRDWQTVQNIWDYIDSYWPEISAKEKRQTGVSPTKVEAKQIISAPGFVRGGYYPIKYDSRLSGLAKDFNTKDLAQELMGGRFGKAQTKNGHTKERGATATQPVTLDLAIAHSHVEQVMYDLEIGEAVASSWKILHDPRIREAFTEKGKQSDFDALEIWLQDVAAGERVAAGGIQSIMRHVRSGFTISRLALNVSTALIQPTGLVQSGVLVGKRAVARGTMDYMNNPKRWVNEVETVSSLMRERKKTFERDIYNVVGDLEDGPVTGRWAKFQRDVVLPASFVMMQSTQFYTVDMPTWVSAYQKEVKASGNEQKARDYADLMVKRAQGSGLMSDRGMLERGTLNAQSRQQEFPRMLTALGSYMFAKGNVFYESARKTDFKDPVQVMSFAIDVGLLFTLEAVLYSAVKGYLPTEDEDDPLQLAGWLGAETLYSMGSTVPLVREFTGALQGFNGGGIFGSSVEVLAKPMIQAAQGEADKAFVNSIVDAGGVLLHLPSSQSKAAINAFFDDEMSIKRDINPLAVVGLGGGKGRSIADLMFGN